MGSRSDLSAEVVDGAREVVGKTKDAVKGGWNLVCIAFNLKRLYALAK